jgi:trimethylamine:corrinoid methyltransferase-like protein
MLDSGMILDPAQLVIDDEIAAMVKRFVGGVAVSDERYASMRFTRCALRDFCEQVYPRTCTTARRQDL